MKLLSLIITYFFCQVAVAQTHNTYNNQVISHNHTFSKAKDSTYKLDLDIVVSETEYLTQVLRHNRDEYDLSICEEFSKHKNNISMSFSRLKTDKLKIVAISLEDNHSNRSKLYYVVDDIDISNLYETIPLSTYRKY